MRSKEYIIVSFLERLFIRDFLSHRLNITKNSILSDHANTHILKNIGSKLVMSGLRLDNIQKNLNWISKHSFLGLKGRDKEVLLLGNETLEDDKIIYVNYWTIYVWYAKIKYKDLTIVKDISEFLIQRNWEETISSKKYLNELEVETNKNDWMQL